MSNPKIWPPNLLWTTTLPGPICVGAPVWANSDTEGEPQSKSANRKLKIETVREGRIGCIRSLRGRPANRRNGVPHYRKLHCCGVTASSKNCKKANDLCRI